MVILSCLPVFILQALFRQTEAGSLLSLRRTAIFGGAKQHQAMWWYTSDAERMWSAP